MAAGWQGIHQGGIAVGQQRLDEPRVRATPLSGQPGFVCPKIHRRRCLGNLSRRINDLLLRWPLIWYLKSRAVGPVPHYDLGRIELWRCLFGCLPTCTPLISFPLLTHQLHYVNNTISYIRGSVSLGPPPPKVPLKPCRLTGSVVTCKILWCLKCRLPSLWSIELQARQFKNSFCFCLSFDLTCMSSYSSFFVCIIIH